MKNPKNISHIALRNVRLTTTHQFKRLTCFTTSNIQDYLPESSKNFLAT